MLLHKKFDLNTNNNAQKLLDSSKNDLVYTKDKSGTSTLHKQILNTIHGSSAIKFTKNSKHKIFTAVKSVPNRVTSEIKKSENYAYNSFPGNRKRKVTSKCHSGNENAKYPVYSVNQVESRLASNSEKKSNLHQKPKSRFDNLGKCIFTVIEQNTVKYY